MSIQSYSNFSQYSKTPQTSWYLDVWVDNGIEADDTDIEIIVKPKYNHRPDLLAYDLYGNPNLCYVFVLINDNISDPIFDLKSGMVIKIPTKKRLQDFFGV